MPLNNIPNPEEIRLLKRKDLSVLCKEAGIKQVGLTLTLAEKVIQHYYPTEAIDPIEQESPNPSNENLVNVSVQSSKNPLKPLKDEPAPSKVYKPFDSFSRLFKERSTPLKPNNASTTDSENISVSKLSLQTATTVATVSTTASSIKSVKLFQDQCTQTNILNEAPAQQISDAVMAVDEQPPKQPANVEDLFEQLLDAFHDPLAVPQTMKQGDDVTVSARCVVTGKQLTLERNSWGVLKLKRGRVMLCFKNTEKEFLFDANELAAPIDNNCDGADYEDFEEGELVLDSTSTFEHDNLVCPDIIYENDARWLQREIEKMRICRDSPMKARQQPHSTPTKSYENTRKQAILGAYRSVDRK